MLILLALVVGIALCYLAYGCLAITFWSDEGRWIGYTLALLGGISGLFLIGWFIYQVITLS